MWSVKAGFLLKKIFNKKALSKPQTKKFITRSNSIAAYPRFPVKRGGVLPGAPPFLSSLNETNSENRHLEFLIFKKEQENDGVGDISSLFHRHCQTNRLGYKQAMLYIYKVGKLLLANQVKNIDARNAWVDVALQK